ncbi:MAG TPA: GGDEF domain-containing protein [Pseudomonadota bacterium]|nr:GGDEF domain-containing protein [Pseudomonadota bacterium]
MTVRSTSQQRWHERRRAVSARLLPILFGANLSVSERLQQQRVLKQRLLSMACVVAVGLIAWIPIDLQTLPTTSALQLLSLRLALALAVLLLAWIAQRTPRLSPVIAIALFIGLQAIGFAWMESEIPNNADPLLRLGYGLFPFIIAAQIAVFPLPLAVTLALSMPAVGLLLLPAWQGPFAPELSLYGSAWLLLLIIVISSWAGASQLLLLLDLLRARNDAAHDGLTGLANRRSAMTRLTTEIAQAQRRRQPLALLALDLDRFKQVNDVYGHAAGDRVLIEFAATLRANLRLGDLGARTGGEEFIAVLPQTDRDAAAIVAERIRAQCADLPVSSDDGRVIRFSVSIGVALLDGRDSSASLLARADSALYQAKRDGRNRVTFAGNWSG